MEGQTDAGQSDPYVPLCFAGHTKIVAAFRGIHVVPVKHTCSDADRQMDGPYVPLCFSGNTTKAIHVWLLCHHLNFTNCTLYMYVSRIELLLYTSKFGELWSPARQQI